MDETIQQAIKDIRYVMPLTTKQEEYIKIVLEEVFLYGERQELINGLERSKKHEYKTEEQLIEHERMDTDGGGPVTNKSVIL